MVKLLYSVLNEQFSGVESPTVGQNVCTGQNVGALAPLGENVPATQATHALGADAPVLPLYVPPGHGVGASAPIGQYPPTGQVTLLATIDPAGQYHPAVHLPEQLAVDNPTTLPYTPAGHAPHVVVSPDVAT